MKLAWHHPLVPGPNGSAAPLVAPTPPTVLRAAARGAEGGAAGGGADVVEGGGADAVQEVRGVFVYVC